jgi:Tol biopolymer transport system component
VNGTQSTWYLRLVLAPAIYALLTATAQGQAGWAIYTMNADGSDVRNVSQNNRGSFGAPGWSHDGKKLTYHGVSNGATFTNSHIFVHRLGEVSSDDLGPGSTPSFSPDDQQIAFTIADWSVHKLKRGIWVMNGDGKNREWISEGERPRWSPEGDKLVFMSKHEGFHSLYLYDIVSLERTRILGPGYDQIIGASFSPDVSRLVYVGYKGGAIAENSPNGELAVVDAQSGAVPEVLLRGRVGWHPDWSPEGTKILFRVADEVGIERLQVLDLEGAAEAVILPNQVSKVNGNAVWSSDGKRIAFASDRGD